jgi:tetratricopeptide (TPR) repeat protein
MPHGGEWRARLRRLAEKPWLVYVVFLCGFTVILMLGWPITASDTDLWYHLTAGRHILERGTIPRESFFSFVSPPRPFVDYYWGFQAFIAWLYRWAGYHGLIVFRALIYAATTLLAVRLLVKGQRGRGPLAWFAFLGACYAIILVGRGLVVRPHLFTYLFIVLLLSLLELRSRRTWPLLLLGVLWCNLHGVTYPVLWLIVGAYAVEEVLRRKARHPFPWRLLAAMATVLATPHGFRLLPVPLTSTVGASQYISELRPLHLPDVLSLSVNTLMPSYFTVFNVMLFAVVVAGIASCARRPFRVSHLLLAAGGAALLFRGNRFMYEFVLLALPLLRANPLIRSTRLTIPSPRPVYFCGVTVLLLLPLNVIMQSFATKPAYPFSRAGLPDGVATFLSRTGAGGTVLNDPNNGGYLQWALYPRYRIFMDMQVPFLFSDEDIYFAQNMFTQRPALERILSRYHPSFLTVPLPLSGFPELIKEFPEYVPVFFDDEEVLYVDRGRHPDIAGAHELKALQPFALFEQNLKVMLSDGAQRPLMLAEARRMLRTDPSCSFTNQLAALAYFADQQFDLAIPHAEAIIRGFPDRAMGYWLKADALKGLKDYRGAIAAYEQALERVEGEDRASCYRQIGLAYLELGEHEKAYRILKDSVEVFSWKTPANTLYNLGRSAQLSGRPKEAEMILRYLYEYKTAPDDTEWAQRLKQDLTNLGTDVGERR